MNVNISSVFPEAKLHYKHYKTASILCKFQDPTSAKYSIKAQSSWYSIASLTGQFFKGGFPQPAWAAGAVL